MKPSLSLKMGSIAPGGYQWPQLAACCASPGKGLTIAYTLTAFSKPPSVVLISTLPVASGEGPRGVIGGWACREQCRLG